MLRGITLLFLCCRTLLRRDTGLDRDVVPQVDDERVRKDRVGHIRVAEDGHGGGHGAAGLVELEVQTGGLMIHGLQPGPLLYSQHPELVGGIMVAYFMANVVMYVMELGLMKAFVRMVNVKLSFLFPAIVACCVLGVYTLNNRMFDVWVMIIFGFVGYLLICLGIDMAPVILGFILGPLIEKYMRMALFSANGNWADMFNRPVSVFFVVIAILFVVVPVIKKAGTHGKEKA